MTIMDRTTGSELEERWNSPSQTAPGQQQIQQHPNVGDSERMVSLAAGSILALLGISRRSIPGLIIAGVGGAMIHRGATGHCYMYESMGVDTAHPERDQEDVDREISEHGIHVAQSFLINRSVEELYTYWRNFQNLPRIMSHLQEVRVTDDRRSHWVAKAPRIYGGKVEWDAEITQDEPNQLIAWRSLAGSDIDTAGQITFSKAMGDRGSMVHVTMQYVPPAGKLGHFIASMLGENPKRVVREDLRNFKRVMEIGEPLTIIGQPHGTCTGRGKEYTESDWRPLFT